MNLRDIAHLAETIQPVLILAGGLWGFYLYRLTRKGEARVGIEASMRLVTAWQPGRSLLLVRLRIANTSSVLYRHGEAQAILFDARKVAEGGRALLSPFAAVDPVPPVYGELSLERDRIRTGDPFVLEEEDQISLEPGEHFDTEVAFPLDEARLGLMAMRVLITGHQRSWRSRAFKDDAFWWGSFFYIDPYKLDENPSLTESSTP